MLIKLDQVITGEGKKPIRDGEKDLTVGTAILVAMMAKDPSPNGCSAEEAVKAKRLFDKIDSNIEADLKSDEIVYLKELVSARLSRVIAGAICLALEPE